MTTKFLVLLLSITFCFSKISYTATLTFSNDKLDLQGKGIEVLGTNATITNSGSYLVTGKCNEGSIKIKVSSVNLYLENLELSSSLTAPIIVNSNLEKIKIISVKNVILNDLESSDTTLGECAVIKIKKNSKVSFQNENDFNLKGNCKNVIKGGKQTSITFNSSNGNYIIEAYQNGISSDGLLTFNYGKFNITTKKGDGIKSSPEKDDTDSLGKIIVNDGIFNISSYADAFQAKNNLIIKKGIFNILTENGYTSTSFDKGTSSAKGFKVSNNMIGCGIKVYNGTFSLNTADDGFHSKGNLTLIDGNYTIYSKDDGIHSDFHIIIGKNDSSTTPYINILSSYEAIEGMSIRIYSGKINVTAEDDAINAAGNNNTQISSDNMPNSDDISNDNEQILNGENIGNESYFISIYGGEINVFCDGDGLDSNGNIFIHGGDINIFSQGDNLDNDPIDHDGNFTLFSANVLGVGSKGMCEVHKDILKGNQMYAYYDKSDISKDKLLIIENENKKIIKIANITKNVNYIFYSSQDLNNQYKFYIANNSIKYEYTFIFNSITTGEDDQDTKFDDGGDISDIDDDSQSSDDEEESDDGGNTSPKKGENDGSSNKNLLIIILCIIIPILIVLIIIFIIYKRKKNQRKNDILLKDGINKELESREIID